MKKAHAILVAALLMPGVAALAGSQKESQSSKSKQQESSAQAATGGSGQQMQMKTSFENKAPKDVISAAEKNAREYQSAFNRHDANALSNLFTDDATYYGVSGIAVAGKQDIKSELQQEQQGPFKNATINVTVQSTRQLTPQLAQVETLSNISGIQQSPQMGTIPSQLHATVLAMKQGNDWKILSLRVYPQPQNQMGVGGAGSAGQQMQTGQPSGQPSGETNVPYEKGERMNEPH